MNLLAIDKGYYDYDFEPKPPKVVTIEETMKTESEVREIARRFGFGFKKETKDPSKMNIEELQEYAMGEIEKQSKIKQ